MGVLAMALVLVSAWLFFERKIRRQLRRHYAVYRALNIPLWVVDAQGNILLSQKETQGERSLAQIPLFANGEALALVRAVLADGEERTCEYVADGRVFRASFQYLSGSSFGRPAVLVFSIDVSELTSARATFEKMAEDWRVTMESMTEAVIVTDAKGIVTFINRAAERLKRLSREAVVGRPWESMCKTSRLASEGVSSHPIHEALCGNPTTQETARLVFQDAAALRVAYTASPIRDKSGVVTGSVLVCRDVTEAFVQRERLRERNYHLGVAAKLAHMQYFRCPCAENFLEVLKREAFWPKKNGRALDPMEFVNLRDLAFGRRVWERMLAKKQREAEIFYRLDLSGHPMHVSVRLVSSQEDGDEIFGVIQDVTELRETAVRHKEVGELLQLILDHIPDTVFVKDYDNGGRFLLCNRHAREIGLSDAVLGKTDYDIYPPEIAAKFVADDAAVIRFGKSLCVVEPVVLPDGRKLECQTVKVGLWRGGRRLLIGICHDMTEVLANRRALEESNKLLNAILENIPAVIAVKDADNQFRYVVCNRGAELRFGRRAGDVIGKNNAELKLYSEADIVATQEEDERVARTGHAVDRIAELKLRSGEALNLRLFKTRIQSGGRTLLLSLALDISEQVRLQDERARLLDEAKLHFAHEKTLNQCLEMVALGKNVVLAVERILEKIATAAAVDACCLLRIDRNSGELWLDEAWFSPGKERVRDAFGKMRLKADGECIQLLDSGGWISLPNIEKTATVVQREAAGAFLPLGARALLLTGIRKRGRLWGVAAFMDMDNIRWWSDAHAHLIGSLARIMEIALEARQYLSDLEYSEAEKRLILDSVDLPILLFDRDVQFVRANKAGRRLAGLFQMGAGHVGEKGTFVWPVEPLARDVVADAKPHRRDLKVSGREYLMTGTPITDISGAVKHAVIVGFDMTEFNQNNRRLVDAMERARAGEKAKGYFLATMSHELRTPLNAVIGYSELMQTEKLSSEERINGLRAIHFAGNALLTLVNDILDLSKLEADQMELVREYLDVSALIEGIVAVFRLRAKSKGLQLTFKSVKIPYLMLDGVRLRQVLLNIVGNAVKFTEKGSVDVESSFAPNQDGTHCGTLSIAVRDSGPGIDPAYRERIFHPFEQQSRDRVRGNRIYEGTGLGLAISRRLVDKMDGHIDLKSDPGAGSVFTVVLDGVAFSENLPRIPESPPPLKQNRGMPSRVMIVDDVQMNLNILEAILKKLGISCVACLSAKAALENLGAERPEVIFTDLWMPEMNGEAFARVLREDEKTRGIPRVAITADTQFAQSNAEALFDAVLFKPITIGKIRAVLEGLPLEKK